MSESKTCSDQCDLLLWKNPIRTGKVLGGILVALLVVKKVNLLTLLLRFIYTAMFTTASIEFVTKVALHQGLVTKYGLKECPNTVGTIKPFIDTALKYMPVYQSKMRKLMFAYSPERSYKAAGVVYIAHKLISTFSLWTIAFVSTIATFTLPVVYKTYQKEIDAAVEQGVTVAKSKSVEYQKLAQEKATPYVKQLNEKLGPVGGFVSSKLSHTGTTPASSSAKLAAEVPLEPTATTSGASFPSVPKTELKKSVEETDNITVDDVKEEIEKGKAAAL